MAEVESRHMRGLLRAAGVCPLVVGVAAILAGVGLSAQRAPADGEWRNYFGGTDGSKYSPLAQINKDNVKDLRPAWTWSLTTGATETTPIVHDGVMYLIVPGGNVQALNATNGDLLWKYNTGSGVFSSPSTYMVNGEQFVAVASGGGDRGRRGGDLILAFALPPRQ